MKGFSLLNLRTKSHEKILEELEQYITDLVDSNEKLKEQLNNYNKDEEIQRLKDEVLNLRRNSIHIMTEKEKMAAELFSTEHYYSCKSQLGVDYILTGTGIGTAIKIKCNKCKVEKDITDFENW